MKVCLCVTLLNEEETIGALLESLYSQSKHADEIVFVDGGSTDNTLSEISNFKIPALPAGRQISNKKVKFKIYVKPGSSIAQARNYGISMAKSEIIALTDAGCTAKKDWLEKITKPFEKENVDIVAGFYEMTADTSLQKAVAPFLGIPPQRFDPNSFLPSARSMAFRREVWKKVGGFKEKLERAGEDTLFNYQALKKGFRMVRVKEAIVYWEVPRTLRQALEKFYVYAKGDAQAGIWWSTSQQLSTHNLKISSIFARYFLLLLLLFWIPALAEIALIFYLGWSVYKMRDVVTDWKARVWLPVIQIGSDMAVMVGFISGLKSKILTF